MILLRCTGFDGSAARFARVLEAASGERVRVLADERSGPVAVEGFGKIGLDAAAVARLGVHAPPDWTWRCGDYGVYLARLLHPGEAHLWLIEHDVRITGDAARFFALAASRPDIDFLAADLRPAERRWYWTRAVTSRDTAPHRCLFPITRLSARGADALLAKRRRHSAQPRRRLFWPNDEAFVATTMAAPPFVATDFKALDPSLYDGSTFRYHGALDEAEIAAGDGPPVLLHPVLSGEALVRKRERLAADAKESPMIERAAARLAAIVNRRFAW